MAKTDEKVSKNTEETLSKSPIRLHNALLYCEIRRGTRVWKTAGQFIADTPIMYAVNVNREQ